MEIDIWKGDWGLPSVDYDCLRILTFLKFSGAQVKTNVTNNPFRTTRGALPVVRENKRVFSRFEEVAAHLKKKNISPDLALNAQESSEVSAYTNLLRDKLFPALVHIRWVDEKNVEGTHKWYARALPFPLNFYYPGRYRKEAELVVQSIYGRMNDPVMINGFIYGEAAKCLQDLSERLGDRNYFMGAAPCSLDATVYAYLAPLCKAPFANNPLQSSFNELANLQKFVSRISQRYYSQETKAFVAVNEEKVKASSADPEFPHKTRNTFLVIAFATVAMVGYALSNGLVQFEDGAQSAQNDRNFYILENQDEEND